jgi:hypothetical protein
MQPKNAEAIQMRGNQSGHQSWQWKVIEIVSIHI